MRLRDSILNNFTWKLTALFLALCVWFGVKFAKSSTDHLTRRIASLPVHVITSPTERRIFQVKPERVAAVADGEPNAVKNLTEQDIELFVNLVSMPDVPEVIREVLWRAPDGIKLRIEPAFVSVERVTFTEENLNNTLKP